MQADPDFAQVAALIGEPARAAMLAAVLGGNALTATELAHCAGVSPQTASSHLAHLVAGELLGVTSAGRHRYYRLASPRVAQVLETLAAIAPPAKVRSLRQSDDARAVRFARTCYDHLAGTAGVALAERLLERAVIVQAGETYQVTRAGIAWLEERGLNVESVMHGRRAPARACLDWSERRPHLAGAFGAAMTHWFLAAGWLRRAVGSRAVHLTAVGRAGFVRDWDLRFDEPRPM